jgi:hypothetical protein
MRDEGDGDDFVKRRKSKMSVTDQIDHGGSPNPSHRPVSASPTIAADAEELARRAANHTVAQRHVGDTPIKQLAWLVGLVNTPEERLRAELQIDLSTLFYEIIRFSDGPHGSWDLHTDPEDSFDPPEALLRCIAAIKKGLESIADIGKGGWKIPGPRKIQFDKPRNTPARGAAIPGRLDTFYEAELPEALLSRAAEVVAAEGGRLARCDAVECRRLFLRRKRGLFCNNRCALKERQRLWRERHANRTEEPSNA